MQDTSRNHFTDKSNSNGNGKNEIAHFYSLPVVGQTNLEEDEESLDLKQLISVAKHRFRLIIAVALGITTLATLWTLTRKPVYQGNFQLLIEPVNQEQEGNELALMTGRLRGVDYKSQIEVLRSPYVINPLIATLSTRYPEIEYSDLIQIKNSPLEIEQLNNTKILNITYQDSDRDKIDFILNNVAQAYLEYSLKEKRKQIEQGIGFVDDQLPELTERVDKLQAQIENFRQKYNLFDPKEHFVIVAEQLNQQEQKYFETQVSIKETQSLYNNLQQQLGLNPQQTLIASYLSESPRYQNLLTQLQDIEIRLAKDSVRFSPINPSIIALQERREELLGLLEQERAKILGNNLTNAIANPASIDSPSSLRLELAQQFIETANTIETLKLRRNSLESEINSLRTLANQMPRIAREYSELTKELSIADTSLNRFLTAQEELKLEVSQQSIPWEIIARPQVGENPVFPKPPRDIALGLIGGTLLGIACALIAEKLDPVFHSPEEITEMTKLPLLGRVPLQKDLKPLEVKEQVAPSLPQLQIGNMAINVQPSSQSPQQRTRSKYRYNASPFLEAFRSLNTNIRLLGSDSLINSIVISSSIPSEGKSTISSHLAQAAAAMGQKVLLVDADLRRPQVHTWMGLNNEEGLSNILATNLSVESAIQTVPQWENLSIISAGDIPPDPTRLLASYKMKEFMEQLKNSHKYDLIIYDTPPILGFADGRILATRTNGVVLVVRMGKTDRSVLKQNIDNLKMSNISVLGLVANQVKPDYSGSSYYSHYYRDK